MTSKRLYYLSIVFGSFQIIIAFLSFFNYLHVDNNYPLNWLFINHASGWYEPWKTTSLNVFEFLNIAFGLINLGLVSQFSKPSAYHGFKVLNFILNSMLVISIAFSISTLLLILLY